MGMQRNRDQGQVVLIFTGLRKCHMTQRCKLHEGLAERKKRGAQQFCEPASLAFFKFLSDNLMSKGNKHNPSYCRQINHSNDKLKRQLVSQETKASKYGRKKTKIFIYNLLPPQKKTLSEKNRKGTQNFCSMTFISSARLSTTN